MLDQKIQNGNIPLTERSTSFNLESPTEGNDEDSKTSIGKEPFMDEEVICRLQRPVFDQTQFEAAFEGRGGAARRRTWRERIEAAGGKCACSGRKVKKAVFRFLPFIPIMKNYSVKLDLVSDIIAGLTVGSMHIPQGMAYAMLANLDPVYGLYVSLFPVIVYFFFGTSKHVSIGTVAVISLLVGATVDKGGCSADKSEVLNQYIGNGTNESELVEADSSEEMACKLGVAAATTFLTGIIQIIMGVMQLGFVVNFLSTPLTRGFMTGSAVHVFSSQIKYIFKIPIGRYNGPFKLIFLYKDLFSNMLLTNVATLVMSTICIAVLWVTKEYVSPPIKKRLKIQIPIELLLVICGTLASYYCFFESNFGMQVVGDIPTGIPLPQFPPVAERFSLVIVDAFIIAVISFAQCVSMSQAFATKHNYKIDANQELYAHGICSVVCCNLNCYAQSVSLSRSSVQEGAGGHTQVVGLISSSLLLVVLFWIAPLFESLPNCVLACIIIVALKGMFMQFTDLKTLWRTSKIDLSVWLVTFLAVVILDVGIGLFAGIAYSLLTVIGRTQRPYACMLGRLDGTDVYRDVSAYGSAREILGIKIFRYDGSTYFANQKNFVDRLYQLTGCNPKNLRLSQLKVEKKRKREAENVVKKSEKWEKEALKQKEKGEAISTLPDAPQKIEEAIQDRFPMPLADIHHVIIDCSAIGFSDTMGVTMFSEIIKEYKKVKVTVLLAACKSDFLEMLERSDFLKTFDHCVLYPTIHDAVIASVSNSQMKRQLLTINYSEMSSKSSSLEMKDCCEDEDNDKDADEEDDDNERSNDENNDDTHLNAVIFVGNPDEQDERRMSPHANGYATKEPLLLKKL